MSDTRTVAIVTDSTSDISHETAARNGITVVPLNIHFGDEVLIDQVTITTDEFIKKMMVSDPLPTTSQPSVGAFEEAFRKAAREHDVRQIVCITISSKLSGTYQSAILAAQEVAADIHVSVVDSGTASYALGFQALNAAALADAGVDATHIVETLQNETGRYQVAFFVETLEHLRRGGRIGKAAQLVGTILQLKPLLRVDEGVIVPFERTRTRARAIKALEAFARDMGPVQGLAVLYNTTRNDAESLAKAIAVHTPGKEPVIAQVGPVIASHLGPDILGVVVVRVPE